MPERDDVRAEDAAPGERRRPTEANASRRLAQPPSARYASLATASPETERRGSALSGPLAKALLVGTAGAILLTVVGAILTSTAGLLFVAGVTGAVVGLVLAGAAVPAGSARPIPRQRIAWLSVGVAVAAVVVGSIATWLIGRAEGGVLGPVDYLIETFGPFVPGEAILAALGAWWGAGTGPVQR